MYGIYSWMIFSFSASSSGLVISLLEQLEVSWEQQTFLATIFSYATQQAIFFKYQNEFKI
jgi:hypothetical protein